MQFFCYMGALACSTCISLPSNYIVAWHIDVIFACIGYAGSIVFYNAYLPEIVEHKDQDRVSAKGFAYRIYRQFHIADTLKPYHGDEACNCIGLSGDNAREWRREILSLQWVFGG